MTVASGMSRAHGRRERDLLSARRRRAGRRMARERTRNSRLAIGGFVALAALTALAVHIAWTPPMAISLLTISTDAASLKFAETRIGRLFFDSFDGPTCREMEFNNDTGRFSNVRKVRCYDDEDSASTVVDSRERALALRSGFMNR
jgi:hypothetical protein